MRGVRKTREQAGEITPTGDGGRPDGNGPPARSGGGLTHRELSAASLRETEEEEGRSTSDSSPPPRVERGGKSSPRRKAGPRGEGGEIDRSPHRRTGTRARVHLTARAPTLAPRQAPSARLHGGQRGRTSPRTHLGRQTHQPSRTTTTSLFQSLAGGNVPSHTASDNTQDAAAAAGPGRPSKPQLLPPAGNGFLSHIRPRRAGPDRCTPGRPPNGGSGGTAAGRPRRGDGERTADGRGVGTTRQNEGRRRRQGRPQQAPHPRKAPSEGQTREAARVGDQATRGKRAGITPHTPCAVPPRTPAASRADPKPTAPREGPRRRQHEGGPGAHTPMPTDEDPRAAAGPDVRRRAGRGRPPVFPKETSAPRERDQSRETRTLP